MTNQVLARARAGDENAFRELTDPYRRELQIHIYRIVGSVHDAEDLLQETLLAAWRGLEGFEARASVRAWLYKIATNRALDALRATRRRPEEMHRVTEMPEPTRYAEAIWLEPFPDVLDRGVLPVGERAQLGEERVASVFLLGAGQHCVAGRGCVPATQASYDACFHLALQRGLTVTVGDKRNLDLFIYQCLAGRIPR